MRLHDLRPAPGSKKKRTRKGTGYAAGKGKTAGRGTKGQLARTGGGKAPYFEGGQLPLVRRLPFKRGFTNIFRTEYQEVNLEDLHRFEAGEVVNGATLVEKRLVKDADRPVVVLGRGEMDRALTVQVHRISKSARAKIEAAGGAVEIVPLLVKGPRATVRRLRKEQMQTLAKGS
ncbi:MAG: 50S ribosomal protein L15 [Anaerolineae bacterium]|nr:50S ribosomal protein L15 [Anaerolineae bacterium]